MENNISTGKETMFKWAEALKMDGQESFESPEVIIPLSYLETLIRENERLKVNSEKKQVTNTVVNVDCDICGKLNVDGLAKRVIENLDKRSFEI